MLLSPFDADPRDRAAAQQVGANDVVPLMRPAADVVDDVLAAIARPPAPASPGVSPAAEADAHRRRHRGAGPAGLVVDPDLQRRARITILDHLMDGLVQGEEPTGLLGEVLARVLDVVGGARGAVYLVDEGGQAPVVAAVGYPNGGDDRAVPQSFRHHTLLARAWARDEPVIAVSGDPDLAEVLVANGCRSIAAVPLRASRQRVGSLVVACPHPELTAWRDFLAAIGDQVGLAVRLGLTVEQLTAYDRLNRHRLRHDAVTGLANDVLLGERLGQLTGGDGGEGRGAVVLVGLERFQALSQSFGPQVANAVLRDTAARLSERLSDDQLLARIGEGEFAVLAPDATAQTATQLSRRLAEEFHDPIACGDASLYVTASIGISLFPDHGRDIGTLRQRANLAAQRAKVAPARVEVYASEWDAGAPTRMAVEQALRSALRTPERGGLALWYQPLVQLPTRQVRAVEALLRWADPRLGAVAPAQVLPVAEEAGLMGDLGQWVLLTACRQATAFAGTGSFGAGRPALEVAVNVDAAEIAAGDLAERVAAALHETGLPPELLCIEVTETAAMVDLDHSAAVLSGVRALGAKVALDDFGTGYSSLVHLQRLPIDRVKIDRSFVKELSTDADNAEIVGAVVDLAHRLGLTAVAEGVETEQQASILVELGCDEAQGHLFSPPLPASDLGQLARDVIVLPDVTTPPTLVEPARSR